MSPRIEIRVDGKNYEDFKSATISYGMETIARGFSFDFSDKIRRDVLRKMPFRAGAPVEIRVYGEKVIDGYVSSIPIDYDAQNHAVGVTGRSWTGHLVDCSAVYKSGSWKHANLMTIAQNLCEPHGIVPTVLDPAILPDMVAVFPKWAIEDEETVADCLRRAAKMRAVFMTTNNGRDLVFTRASKVVQPGVLKYGTNILSASREDSFDDRFSYYLVKSQSAGDDTFFADDAGKNFFRIDDPEVETFRPLIIVSDGQGRRPDLEKRARWERNTRAGRSRRIRYSVQGFRNAATNKVWPVNQLIAVDDDLLDTKDLLLVISVQLTISADGGEKAALELGAPQQFDVLAPDPPKPKKRKKKLSW